MDVGTEAGGEGDRKRSGLKKGAPQVEDRVLSAIKCVWGERYAGV